MNKKPISEVPIESPFKFKEDGEWNIFKGFTTETKKQFQFFNANTGQTKKRNTTSALNVYVPVIAL